MKIIGGQVVGIQIEKSTPKPSSASASPLYRKKDKIKNLKVIVRSTCSYIPGVSPSGISRSGIPPNCNTQ